MTAETHYVNGGLGSLVAEVIAEHGLGCRLIRRGVRDASRSAAPASCAYMLSQAGLDAAGIARSALQALASTEP